MIKSNFYEKYIDTTLNLNRRYKYFFDCIADKLFFKETRVLNVSGFFFDKFNDDIHKSTDEMWKIEKKMATVEIGMKCISICGYCAVFLLLIFSLSEEHITAGACSAIFISVKQIYELMNELFGRQIGTLLQNRANIKYYLKLMNTEEKENLKGKKTSDAFVEANRISFFYPNTNKLTIKNVSLGIKQGEVIAIVGNNGSGKTTLAKLLCGIYKPQYGEISEGTNVENMISAIFQNFSQYKLSVKDNVLISNLQYEKILRWSWIKLILIIQF